jgi:hypothetical protein
MGVKLISRFELCKLNAFFDLVNDNGGHTRTIYPRAAVVTLNRTLDNAGALLLVLIVLLLVQLVIVSVIADSAAGVSRGAATGFCCLNFCIIIEPSSGLTKGVMPWYGMFWYVLFS